MTTPAATIGFVGLGDMGGAMVRGLLRADLSPTVFDLDSPRVEAVAGAGATPASSLAEVATADVVGVCVATDEQVLSVVDGLLAHLQAGSVLSLHSTLLPATVLEVRDRARGRGVGVVEAPVAGGAPAAAEGRLTMFLAGADEDLAVAEPLVDACTALRIPTGELGTANLVKLCTNLHTYAVHMATNEAVLLAKSLGVPTDGLLAAIDANGHLGESTRNYLILHEVDDAQLDDPAFVDLRAPQIAVIAKDLRLLEDVAASVGFDLRVGHLAGELVEDTYRMPDRSR